MVRATATEAYPRASQGGGVPFFRVRLNPDQHAVLVDLENRVSGNAVVRYAAPMFHEIEDLWERQSRRTVFDGSAFVSPNAAGLPPPCWTYDEGAASIFCSVPRRSGLEGSDEVLRALIRTSRGDVRPERGAHLRALASQIESIDLTRRRKRRRRDEFDDVGRFREPEAVEWVPPLNRSQWVERLRGATREGTDLEPDAVDAAVVAGIMGSIGLTWLLAEIRPRSTGE